MDYIDVPSENIMPELEKTIREQISEVVLPGQKKIEIEKIEWTKNGLRIWTRTEK